MGSKPKARDIDVPDPLAIIEAEKNANRTDAMTPFGSSRWQGDTQVTEFGPQMQQMSDRMFGLGMQDSQRIEPPEFLGDLGSAIASRVGDRYGGVEKPPPSMPMPTPQTMPGEANMAPSPMPQGPVQQGPPIDPQQLEELRRRMGGGNQLMSRRSIR